MYCTVFIDVCTDVKTVAEKVKTALKGKGGGKGVTIQGKATEMEHLQELYVSLSPVV